jgi:atypical dual specificity phosphatase
MIMVKNFHFEEPGKIARSGYPESAEEIDWLHAQGIRTIVSLHPLPDAARARMDELEIRWLPYLLEDWSHEVPEGLGTALKAVAEAAQRDPVLIHCQGGGGRAGTFYAAYLISQEGLTADEAIGRVTGVERDGQKAFLYGFAAGRSLPE